MAIIENGYLRGQIGNLVNRKVGDKNVVQTKPSDKTKQTRWTEAAASDFGTASAAGSLIRRAFRQVFHNLHDSEMNTRLNKHMQRVLRGNGKYDPGYLRVSKGNIQRLVDFQFNAKCHIYDYVYAQPQVSFAPSGTTTILIPALDVQRNFNNPKSCSHITLKIDVIGFHFSSKCFNIIGTHESEYQLYNGKTDAQTLVFDVDDNNYESILVCLSTTYISKKGNYNFLLNSKDLNPAGIIAAYNL